MVDIKVEYVISIRIEKDNKYKYLKYNISHEEEAMALNKAFVDLYSDIFIEKWRDKSSYDTELEKLKKGLNKLETETCFGNLSNLENLKSRIGKEFKKDFKFPEMSVSVFETFNIYNQIDYLEKLGYFVKYFIIPKNEEINIITIDL